MSQLLSPPTTAPPLDDLTLRKKLLNHARARLRDDDAAEDAVQEALARAVKRQSEYNPDVAPLIGWLFGFLKLVICEESRKRHKQPSQPPPDMLEWEQLEVRLHPARDAAELQKFLAELPDEPRQIVSMHHLEGLSHAEIGARLGITEGNSRIRLARAMTQLKRLAAKEGAR